MDKAPYPIKTDKKVRYGMILMACFAILSMFIKLENGTTNYKTSPGTSKIIVAIAVIIIAVNTYKLIKQSSSILLSTEGIKFSGSELFQWETINSFQIINYRSSENSEVELQIFFTNGKKHTERIDYLEIGSGALVDLILTYQDQHGILYLGYKEV